MGGVAPGHDGDGGRALRVLIAKPGLDGHDRGAKVVARSLKDAGVDVTYSGLHRSPEEIVALAVGRDVDAIGLSILSGAHVPLVEELTRLLRARGAGHIVLFVGGTIPDADVPLLRELGADAVFTAGAHLDEIETRLRTSIEHTGDRRDPGGARSRAPGGPTCSGTGNLVSRRR